MSTEESYARTLTRFASAAIRTLYREKSRFHLRLRENIQDKARDLFEALDSLSSKKSQELEKNAVIKLQEFFFAAVTDSVKESQDDRFKCPVLTYIACFAYNKDDTFKLPSQVTSMLAQWEFLLRCTAIYHGHMSFKAKKSESVVR